MKQTRLPYAWMIGNGSEKGTPFLYNLKTDIHEDHDIALQHPDIVEKMKAIIFEQHTPNPHFSVTLPKR